MNLQQGKDLIGKNPFFIENNYSGQIHCNKDKILVFNKNFEDISQKYPEIKGYISTFINNSKEKKGKEIKSFILDCTFLTYDKKIDRILNTQEIIFFPKEMVLGRSQKQNNHVCVFCHDIFFLIGEY